MKLSKKNNISFLQNGGCFLYYFEENPKCFLTHSLIRENDFSIFDSPKEIIEFSSHDCLGDIRQCKYINNLWNLHSDEIDKMDEMDEIDEIDEIDDNQTFSIGNITIDFEYSLPQDNPILTDILFIPTNTALIFSDFMSFHNNNDLILSNECKKRQLIFDTGDCIITHGANTGYPKIAHCIISNPDNLVPEIQDIGLSLYNALMKAEDIGCKSIAIYPLVKIDKDIVLPNISIYLKICITTIKTFISEYEVNNLSYILIHIPADFHNILQDVMKDI